MPDLWQSERRCIADEEGCFGKGGIHNYYVGSYHYRGIW